MNEEDTGWLSSHAEVMLRDNYLSFQIFDVYSLADIRILSVLEGETDKKLHLSGLNFYHSDFGWLFGGIDER